MLILIVFDYSLISFHGCGNETTRGEKAAYISVVEDFQYEKTFKDLSIGILYDYNFKVNNADKSWVTIWVEGYKNGEKTEPFQRQQEVSGTMLLELKP